MATYAIGDIQGCKHELVSLLEHINFDSDVDRLWFAGDLVNRGPDSLGALRLIYSLRNSSVIVLGNHDLHMLAIYDQIRRGGSVHKNPKDNFYDIFDAEDAEQLLTWLQLQPLLHAEDEFLLVHAGVYPLWDRQTAMRYAREVEQVLAGENASEFFQAMYGNLPDSYSEQLAGNERLRFITNTLTRMRYCYQDARLDLLCKSPVSDAGDNLIPWFNVAQRVKHQGTILHGHWASLTEKEPAEGIISLDTGCVWGGSLSAWCLEEKKWYSVKANTNNK